MRGWKTRRAKQAKREQAHADVIAMLESVARWLTVLESDEEEIEVLTHAEMLEQVRGVLADVAVRS